MNSKNHSLILEKYTNILNDLSFLIKNNLIPIHKFQKEDHPDKIQFSWNPVISKKEPSEKIQIIRKFDTVQVEKNFICKLCKNKLSGIRSFIKTGNKPILVLHYSGEIRKGKKAISKTNSNLIFRTEEEDDLFDRMIRKVFGFPFTDFFYQEYPACNFNPNELEPNWQERILNCEKYVIETILKENIQGILIVGTSAVLKYGKEKVLELIGKTIYMEITDKKIPTIVLRSPEAILSLEEKRKKFEKNKDSDEYKNAKNEENSIKKQIIEELTRFKGLIQI